MGKGKAEDREDFVFRQVENQNDEQMKDDDR